MLERRRARITWALGLIVVLCSYNLAFANVKISESTGAPSAKVSNIKLNDVGVKKASTTDTSPKTVPANRKKASTVKDSATGANSCACSCSTKAGRAAAAPGPWWDCMKGCLRSWGVSPIQIALCVTACSTGMIPVCAICLALDATVFLLCSIGCEVYKPRLGYGDEGYEPILVRKLPLKNGKKAERRALALAAAR